MSKEEPGPTTPEGKLIASRNAAKHLMTGRVLLIEGENPSDLAALVALRSFVIAIEREAASGGHVQFWPDLYDQDKKFIEEALAKPFATESKHAKQKGRGCAPPMRKGTRQPFRRGA